MRYRQIHRTVCTIASSFLAGAAHAQFFSAPAVDIDWNSEQTAYTFDTTTGEAVCVRPWNEHVAHSGGNLTINDTLATHMGGCPLVTLVRNGNFNADVVPGASATLSLLARIEATAISEITRRGDATGWMEVDKAASFVVDRWCTADLLLRFIADAGRSSATTSLSARFFGPVDPATGEPVLCDESWTGTTRDIRTLEGLMLAPGRYELRAFGQGAFTDLPVNLHAAQTTAYAKVDAPAAIAPPAAWDLDADGLVGLTDACLWADDPTDTNGDGDIQLSDLNLLLALARAAGDDATDLDSDGIPDQCQDGCLADFNADGLVNFFDVQAFLGAFAAGNTAADANGDGILDFFDLLAFLGVFSEGCAP